MSSPRFKRIILKVSGELLAGKKNFGIDHTIIDTVSREIFNIYKKGIEIGIIIGGGNIFRGVSVEDDGMQRIAGDHMGMLATVINCIALQDHLERYGAVTRLCSAISMEQIAEPFIRRRALRHLEKGRIVIFAAGTGNPNFTTDTAAALRAVEMEADIILKGTRVDGIYNKDPKKHSDAKKYSQLTYIEVVKKGLKVMDPTAVTLAMDNNVPILVFNLSVDGNLTKIVNGKKVGTTVRD